MLPIKDLYFLAAPGEAVGVLEVVTYSPLLTHSFSTLAASFPRRLPSLFFTSILLLFLPSSSLFLFSILWAPQELNLVSIGTQGLAEMGATLAFHPFAFHHLLKESEVTSAPFPPTPGYQDLSRRAASSRWTSLDLV